MMTRAPLAFDYFSGFLGLVVGIFGVALDVGLQAVGTPGQLLRTLAVLGAAASGTLSSFVV